MNHHVLCFTAKFGYACCSCFLRLELLKLYVFIAYFINVNMSIPTVPCRHEVSALGLFVVPDYFLEALGAGLSNVPLTTEFLVELNVPLRP